MGLAHRILGNSELCVRLVFCILGMEQEPFLPPYFVNWLLHHKLFMNYYNYLDGLLFFFKNK